MKRVALGIVGILLLADLFLLVSGNRVLASERIVQPGEDYPLEIWGNVGDAEQAGLVCNYWTGRSIKPEVYWYGSGGKDQCPFILNPEAN